MSKYRFPVTVRHSNGLNEVDLIDHIASVEPTPETEAIFMAICEALKHCASTEANLIKALKSEFSDPVTLPYFEAEMLDFTKRCGVTDHLETFETNAVAGAISRGIKAYADATYVLRSRKRAHDRLVTNLSEEGDFDGACRSLLASRNTIMGYEDKLSSALEIVPVKDLMSRLDDAASAPKM